MIFTGFALHFIALLSGNNLILNIYLLPNETDWKIPDNVRLRKVRRLLTERRNRCPPKKRNHQPERYTILVSVLGV